MPTHQANEITLKSYITRSCFLRLHYVMTRLFYDGYTYILNCV